MSPEQRVRDFREQAERYRQVAGGVHAGGIRDTYEGWATDLELRAACIEAEIAERAA